MQDARRSALLIAWALLALFLIPSSRADNLVVNGGFETGDFTGWTVTPPPTVLGYDFYCGDTAVDGISDLGPHSGDYSACFGYPSGWSYVDHSGDTITYQPGLTFISQDLTTVPGQSYVLTFWIAQQPSVYPLDNAVELIWNGKVYGPEQLPVMPWTEEQLLVTATGTSTELGFGAMDVPGWVALDDVSVVPTPEPAPMLLYGSGFLLALLAVVCRGILAKS